METVDGCTNGCQMTVLQKAFQRWFIFCKILHGSGDITRYIGTKHENRFFFHIFGQSFITLPDIELIFCASTANTWC